MLQYTLQVPKDPVLSTLTYLHRILIIATKVLLHSLNSFFSAFSIQIKGTGYSEDGQNAIPVNHLAPELFPVYGMNRIDKMY